MHGRSTKWISFADALETFTTENNSNAYRRYVCSNGHYVSSGLFGSLRRRHQVRSSAPEAAGIHARPRTGLLVMGVSECERLGHARFQTLGWQWSRKSYNCTIFLLREE